MKRSRQEQKTAAWVKAAEETVEKYENLESGIAGCPFCDTRDEFGFSCHAHGTCPNENRCIALGNSFIIPFSLSELKNMPKEVRKQFASSMKRSIPHIKAGKQCYVPHKAIGLLKNNS